MSEERPNSVPGGDASGPPPAEPGPTPAGTPGGPTPRLVGGRPRPGSALHKPQPEATFTPEQRLLVLDAWRRSGLPAGDFAPLVGLSRRTAEEEVDGTAAGFVPRRLTACPRAIPVPVPRRSSARTAPASPRRTAPHRPEAPCADS